MRTENTTANRLFKSKSYGLTLPKQLQNNFEKVQKMTFSTPKMAKSGMSIWPKVSIFGSIIDLYELYFRLVGDEKKLKSFALIAKHIQKKKKKNS